MANELKNTKRGIRNKQTNPKLYWKTKENQIRFLSNELKTASVDMLQLDSVRYSSTRQRTKMKEKKTSKKK